MPSPSDDAWKKVWDARKDGLARIFGKPSDVVFHAVTPFHLGGFADVLAFPRPSGAVTYVTAEMTGEESGQKKNSLGNYELMICTEGENPKAADVISKLGRYTCDAVLEPGHTMDLPGFFGDSMIRGLLFIEPSAKLDGFEFLERRYGLLLCVGITADELTFARKHGSAVLLLLLRKNRVFPFTMPNRTTIELP